MVNLLDDDDLLDLRQRARRTDPEAVTREMRAGRRELPDQNAALSAWSPDSGTDASPAEPEAEGTCAICNQREGKHECRKCKRRVCSADGWVMFGLCTECASPERVARWNQETRPEDRNWLE